MKFNMSLIYNDAYNVKEDQAGRFHCYFGKQDIDSKKKEKKKTKGKKKNRKKKDE